ncbi:MFS transporter [Alkalicoccobacillus porphyridii]|uniref:Uncharacterized protein n=1 Tax=Alkalicoccobacillus porphyridii TaxID=2597270 RepID=A0A553ZUN8_9BACI|nr:MFS transporter [Alkalicoccobacillus porphyridii]TSB45194.1 hypothetical protein FN960_17160 [Alkalicoccobacillus porphyridii]
MKQPIRVFVEYKINDKAKKGYEQLMPSLLNTLSEEGATNIEWFEAADQPLLYVEMFEVSTLSHYRRLKQLRQTKIHPDFQQLDPMIAGGLSKLHCWAFQRKETGGESS